MVKTQFSSKDFTWTGKEGVAEVSSLSAPLTSYFTILSEKTGKVVEFVFDRTAHVGEEIVGWVYKSWKPSLGVKVTILND